ncbi:MAG: MFS transporter [Chloroflexi bacterium]|nr:MFS transporter [Chloroflexota bacterium]
MSAPGPLARLRGVYFGWYMIVAATITNMVMGAGLVGYLPGVFLEPMTEELGWSRAEFIISFTIGQFVTAATALAIGSHIDRRGGRGLMLAGTSLTVAALLLTAEVRELWQWVLLRGLIQPIGLGMAGSLVVNVALSKWFVRYRGRAIGIAACGFSLAGIVVPNSLTPVVDAHGWEAGWRVLALVAATLILPASLMMRRQPEDYGLRPDGRSPDGPAGSADAERERLDYVTSLTRGEALRTSALWLIVVAFGAVGLTLLGLVTQAIPLLTDAGFSRPTAAAMLAVLTVPGLLSRPFWGVAAERVDPRRLASAAFVALGTGVLVIVLGARAQSLPLVALGFFAMGSGMAGYVPVQEIMWASFFGRRHLGAVRSSAMPVAIGLGASGPVLVAYYYDRTGSYEGIFVVLSALVLASAALVFLARSPDRRERPEQARPAGR